MTAIAHDASTTAVPYGHLVPLVELLTQHGNRPILLSGAGLSGFHPTQGGWQCDLERPIDFGLIEDSFELPPSIKLRPDRDEILCEQSWTLINGSRRRCE